MEKMVKKDNLIKPTSDSVILEKKFRRKAELGKGGGIRPKGVTH